MNIDKIQNNCHVILYKDYKFKNGEIDGKLTKIISKVNNLFYIDGRELYHLTMLLRIEVNNKIKNEKY